MSPLIFLVVLGNYYWSLTHSTSLNQRISYAQAAQPISLHHHMPLHHAMSFHQCIRFTVVDASAFIISGNTFNPYWGPLPDKLKKVIKQTYPQSLTSKLYHYKRKDDDNYLHIIQDQDRIEWIVSKKKTKAIAQSYFVLAYHAETHNLYSLPTHWKSTESSDNLGLEVIICINNQCMNELKELVYDMSSLNNMTKLFQRVNREIQLRLKKCEHERTNLSSQLSRIEDERKQVTLKLARVEIENQRYALLLNHTSDRTQPNITEPLVLNTQISNMSSLMITAPQINYSKNGSDNIWIFCGLSALFGVCITCLVFKIYHWQQSRYKRDKIDILKPIKYNINGIESVLNKNRMHQPIIIPQLNHNENYALSANKDVDPKAEMDNTKNVEQKVNVNRNIKEGDSILFTSPDTDT